MCFTFKSECSESGDLEPQSYFIKWGEKKNLKCGYEIWVNDDAPESVRALLSATSDKMSRL